MLQYPNVTFSVPKCCILRFACQNIELSSILVMLCHTHFQLGVGLAPTWTRVQCTLIVLNYVPHRIISLLCWASDLVMTPVMPLYPWQGPWLELGLAGGPGRPSSARDWFENRLAGPGPVHFRGLGGVRDRGPVRGRFTLWARSRLG
uniref:Uncharacterized protein n=1 Tax=Solanum tuberosum TaxID=4113 RepID=M1DHZ3_SOLTU